MSTDIHPVLLFDGDCTFCNATVQWFLARDPAGHLRFAPLQSNFALEVLARHNLTPLTAQTVYLVSNLNTPQESIHARSDAVLAALRALHNHWSFLGSLGRLIPRALRNAAYDVVARNRKRIMRNRACILPTESQRARFLDVSKL